MKRSQDLFVDIVKIKTICYKKTRILTCEDLLLFIYD